MCEKPNFKWHGLQLTQTIVRHLSPENRPNDRVTAVCSHEEGEDDGLQWQQYEGVTNSRGITNKQQQQQQLQRQRTRN